ncbi:hypothetical protein GCM10010435_96040 [Winogradskya consettensis]|uniref:Uncharacterized protein n=1 Tax=Winogradskya consettensis TaxID=113560 RepID=A0A919SZL4_9ACTN|nr:hypothetical protein [Actinoplanes consettensis]GIM79938.1 hypothetical protein Aco04nite_68090 [Actinoplanes consettensis]
MLDRAQAEDYVRRYDGVSADVLSDGSRLLGERAFWCSLVDGNVDGELVEALFGDEDSPALYELMQESGQWPVLRLSPGYAVIIWFGYDDEGGEDHVVLTGDGRCVSVAAREGHGYGPGLSWREAERLVEWGMLGTKEQRLLLMLTALGDVDAHQALGPRVVEALLSVAVPGCDPAVAGEAARQLLESDVRWSTQDDGALVCDEKYSPRSTGKPGLVEITKVLATPVSLQIHEVVRSAAGRVTAIVRCLAGPVHLHASFTTEHGAVELESIMLYQDVPVTELDPVRSATVVLTGDGAARIVAGVIVVGANP